MIVFESDEIEVIYEPADSDFLLITFGTVAHRPNGTSFFGQPVTRRAGISALAFTSTRPNWYPAADMRRARDALSGILSNHKQRVMFGFSMGAYGAVKYSGLFEVQTSVAICPQYSIDPREVGGFDRMYVHHYDDKLHTGMSVTKSQCSGDIFIFYDNKHKIDKRHAALFMQSIEPFLIGVPYTGHDTMRCFTGTKVATTLIELCRAKDHAGLDAFVRERRKPAAVRAFHVGLNTLPRHVRWADRILQNRSGDMKQVEAYELEVRLGQEVERRGLNDWAEQAFARAVSLDLPADNRALAGLSRVRSRQGDDSAAETIARKAIEMCPQDSAQRAWLSGLLLRSNDLAGARAEAEAGLSLSPENVHLLRSMIDVTDRSDQPDEAIAWARRAVAAAPGETTYKVRLIHQLRRANDPVAARIEALALIQENLSHPDMLRCMAEISERLLDFGEAADWMHKAVAADPSNLHFRVRLAHLLQRAGDCSEAEQILLGSLDLDPTHVASLRAIAHVCVQGGKLKEAAAWARRASAAAPDDLELRGWFGNLLIAADHFREACALAAETLRRNPQNLTAMRCLAESHARLSEFDEAAQWARTAVSIDPANLDLRGRLAYVLMRANDLQAAEEVLRRSLEIDDTDFDSLRNLADVLVRRQCFDEAIIYTQRAVDIAPANVWLRHWYAVLLLRVGDIETADVQIRAGLSLAPDNAQLRQRMVEVSERLSNANRPSVARTAMA
jgi:tetratricopeptide (TPR) repeat protein